MQYILTGKRTAIKIVFTYDLQGLLKAFEIEGIENEKPLQYLFWNNKFPFPYTKELIEPVRRLGVFHIEEVDDDLSFDRFWQTYGLKVSKKKAEKLWQKLSKADRIKVFLHLPKYEAYLQHKGIEKAYPDTYLRNAKYEDEY
jgi:hypothetical protein